jgi:hypothetical protein
MAQPTQRELEILNQNTCSVCETDTEDLSDSLNAKRHLSERKAVYELLWRPFCLVLLVYMGRSSR